MAKRQKPVPLPRESLAESRLQRAYEEGQQWAVSEMVRRRREASAKLHPNTLKVSAKPNTRDPWTRAADVHAAADHDRLFPRGK